MRVLLTVGTEVDPADLGAVPANVHVERWVPQGAVMAHASAMVGHGGSGSTLAAMAAGDAARGRAAVRRPARERPAHRRPRRRACASTASRGLGERVGALLEDPSYRERRRRRRRRDRRADPVERAVDLLAEIAEAGLPLGRLTRAR